MENKRLMDQFEACQKSYKELVSAAEENFLAEERTIEKLINCKHRALEMQWNLKQFVKVLEFKGYIELPFR